METGHRPDVYPFEREKLARVLILVAQNGYEARLQAAAAYQSPNARLATPSAGTTACAADATGRAESVSPNPIVTSDIDTAVKSARRRSDADGDRLRRDRCEEQDADACAPADAVDEADPECAERGAYLMAMLLLGVRMGVEIEVAVTPTDEEADCEEDDEDGDGGSPRPAAPARGGSARRAGSERRRARA